MGRRVFGRRTHRLRATIQATPFQRRLAAGEGQLAQGEVQSLAVSEWAAILLSPDLQAEKDRDKRLALSLLIAGSSDATKGKV